MLPNAVAESAFAVAPLQYESGVTIVGVAGVGCTVIVKVLEVPVQLLALGVTVTVAIMSDVPLLVAVKLGKLPEVDVETGVKPIL